MKAVCMYSLEQSTQGQLLRDVRHLYVCLCLGGGGGGVEEREGGWVSCGSNPKAGLVQTRAKLVTFNCVLGCCTCVSRRSTPVSDLPAWRRSSSVSLRNPASSKDEMIIRTPRTSHETLCNRRFSCSEPIWGRCHLVLLHRCRSYLLSRHVVF